MNSDTEQYYQAKMVIAKELSKGTRMERIVEINAMWYNRKNDIRYIKSINMAMAHELGKGWCRRKCGINQHGVWVK